MSKFDIQIHDSTTMAGMEPSACCFIVSIGDMRHAVRFQMSRPEDGITESDVIDGLRAIVDWLERKKG